MSTFLRLAPAALLFAAPALAADSNKSQVTDPMDKVVCKRFTETGSLAKNYRTCKTRRQWQIERDAAQETGEKMLSRMSGEKGN